MANTRDEFVKNMQVQIKECGNQIEHLVVRAMVPPASGKSEYVAFVNEARAKRSALQQLLNESRSLIGDDWNAVVFSLENAAKVMRTACDQAMSQTEPTQSYSAARSAQT
jgi:hypothetical protein